MSHGLMLCDIPFYSDLTKVNILAFLSSKMAVVDQIEKFETLLSIDQTYEFIIASSTLKNVEIAQKVHDIKNQYISKRIPLVIIGHTGSTWEDVGHVKGPYEQLEIVKYIIKKLGWTPTDLINKRVDPYIPIPISLFEISDTAIEDLYLASPKDDGTYVLAASKGNYIKELKRHWEGIKAPYLYISSQKRITAISELNNQAIKATQDAINSNDEVRQHKVVDTNMEVLAEQMEDHESFDKLPEEIKEKIGLLSKETNHLVDKVIMKSPIMINELVKLFRNNEKGYLQQLSFLSIFVTLEMIRNESWFSEQIAEKVRYIHFFNNLVLIPVIKKYPDLPKIQSMMKHKLSLAPKEKEVIKWHPKIMASLVIKIPGLPLGLDQIIMQHHGNPHGDVDSPDLFEDISLLAKYVFISEHFVEQILCAEAPINNSLRDNIIRDFENKIKRRSYLKLVEHLKLISF
jgi:hypothetical protein